MDALSSSLKPPRKLSPLSSFRDKPLNSTSIMQSVELLQPAASNIRNTITSAATVKQNKPVKITRSSPRFDHPVNSLLDWFDSIINTFIDPPLHPWLDPQFVLSDNYTPVDELPPTECHAIFGYLPSCLDGAYMRVGPNPQFLPRGPYHFFDGDGMVHCLRITGSGSRVTLSSRYVKTYRFKLERQAGASLFPNLLSGFNSMSALLARGVLAAARIAAGQYDPRKGVGLANTKVALIGSRLYALCESDLPYEIRVNLEGDVLTLGRQDFSGKLSFNMTAHPKLDPETGEVFAFRYGPFRPFLTFFRFDKFGNKSADVPIFSMNRPTLIHDFAITQKYAIFPDTQLGMLDLKKMVFHGGSLVELDPLKVPRLGVIPRHANDDSQMKWFDVPGFNILHTINAWDEVDELGNESIILVAANILAPDNFMKKLELTRPCIERVRIDLSNGTVSRTSLPAATNMEFGVINQAYLARKNRFVYTASEGENLKLGGVVKLDLEAEGKGDSVVVAKRIYGKDCYCGETCFIAREPDNKEADEDDGYLVGFVHDESKEESTFVAMDAKSPDLEIVGSVSLPHRVPYGIHGIFVREKEL